MINRTFAVVALSAAAACARKAETPADSTRATRDSTPPGAVATTPAVADTTTPKATTPAAPRPVPGTAAKAPPPPSPVPAATAPASVDTVRGVIAVVGTDRSKSVVIRPSTGGPSITLLGPQADIASRAAGADVWVSGSRSDRSFTVTTFAVRTVDGLPAVDGQLSADGDRLVLVTADGKRHTIANAPAALREHVGGRVWVSGNLDQGPVSFGVLQDKR